MYAAPWHGCERFHSRPDDPSATDPTSPQTRATPVRECLLLRPRPFHLALRNVRRRSRGLPAVSVFSRRPIYPKSSPDHRFCNFLTSLPVSSRRPSVDSGLG